MRAQLCTVMTVLALVPAAAIAGIQRAPESRESTYAPSPVVITTADRVRIETVPDRARVPPALQGKFIGSSARP